MSSTPVAVRTAQGLARIRWHRGATARGTLLLGHGAGGLRDSPDITALTALADLGWQVGLVDQPWRVAGKRVGPAPGKLDEAWTEIMGALGPLPRPLVHGGRSAGARVVCRCALKLEPSLRPDAILLISFPLHPPGKPERTRVSELVGVLALPTMLVQGSRDPFGTPDNVSGSVAGAALHVIPVAGTHSPNPQATYDAVAPWLVRLAEQRETLTPMEHQW